MGKKKKHKLPLLGSDQDLLKAFTRKSDKDSPTEFKVEPQPLNRHGLPVVDKGITGGVSKTADDPEPDSKAFADLLESYLSRPPARKKSVSPKPMPYHRRIKRYPPPEIDLDLHGFTALGAQLKASSFLTTCKQQGYFTVRIIVGKGRHSDPGPVLPDTIEDLLGDLKAKDIILGFSWERKKKVRSGAVIVYLRQFSD
jgi:DNA-nicking Smr family endonuclease